MRENILHLSDENIENFDTIDKVMIKFLKVWPQISGALDGAKERLPPMIIRDKEKIDSIIKEGKLDKKKRAEIGVRFSLLISDSAIRAYKEFAPGILQLLTMIGLI